MKKNYAPGTKGGCYRWLAAALAVVALPAAHAQTAPPAWTAALAASQPYSGNATALASVADASGNVYVAGNFTGQLKLGGTTLVSAGGSDVFVAKWNAAAGTWTWAMTAGGSDFDGATALALSGSSLYLTGYVSDDTAGESGVKFGSLALPGKNSGYSTQDLFVARLTDAGSSATWSWAVNGGGSRSDLGAGVAVSGTSVYVTGSFVNDAANDQAVTFGALPLNGLSATDTFDSDVVVGKLTDAGSSATWGWVQAAGGGTNDQPKALAASGTGVYVAGYFNNDQADASKVTFGAAGSLKGLAASASDDIFVARLTDAGSSGAFVWAQAAGGSSTDHANALAVSGNSVYVAGYFNNDNSNTSAVTFGVAGALNGQASFGTNDIFVAKLTETGGSAAFTWAQAAGGLDDDQANALAVSGPAVYVGGYVSNDNLDNNTVTFGSLLVPGATATASSDAVVARLTDAGSSAAWAWAQVGGGSSYDNVSGLAVSGSQLYPVGSFSVQASFGTAAGSPLSSGLVVGDFYAAQLTEAAGGGSASWARATQGQTGGTFGGLATALAADGGVYVAGNFTGIITLGSTTLTSAGSLDGFVAKWNPATGAWLWALPAGGLGNDQVAALAVSGTTVYAGGYLSESATRANQTQFGSLPVTGLSGFFPSQDAYIAKLVDAGSTASWSWVQVGGGSGVDRTTALAVSGGSLYAAGYFSNGASNASNVKFGATSLPGYASFSSADVFVTKLADAGSTGSFSWAVGAGGTGTDQALALAVSGTGVYAAGYFTNDQANANTVTFGSTTLTGASVAGTFAGADAFVAKVTDAGSTGSFSWAVGAGGTGTDQALALAVSGTGVYAAGYFTNDQANANAVKFGALSLPGLSTSFAGPDAYVGKLTDAGSSATWTWAQAGGGTDTDQATGLAVSGSNLYVAGYYTTTAANDNTVAFGGIALPGTGTTPNPDAFVVKYRDAGSSASVSWAQHAGSDQLEQTAGLALSGARLALTGFSLGAPAFGSLTLANPYKGTQLGFGALLTDADALATAPAAKQSAFSLYPNPAREAATVAGLPAFAGCQLLDVLGRPVARATADASGTARLTLPAGLAPGVYLVRSGSQALRLTVQ